MVKIGLDLMRADNQCILLVSPVPTDPVDAGNRARIATLTAALSDAGHDVHFAYLPLEPFDLTAMQARFGADRLHILRPPPRPNLLGQLSTGIRKVGQRLKLERAFQWRLDDWYPDSANEDLLVLHKKYRFDTVFAEYVFISRALEASPDGCLRVLDTHDSFGLRHQMFLNAGMRPRWFSTSVADEERGFRRADIVLAIQTSEAHDFAARIAGSSTRVLHVGHLIDIGPVSPRSTCEAAVFVGSSNAINVEGVRHFVDRILPIVRRTKPDFELLLAGAVCDKVEPVPGVIKLGFVESLSVAYARAILAVNPVQLGSGINIKLLDAMAAGMPVVTTRSGARGLDQYHERAFLVAHDDDADEFARWILRLLDDETLRQRMSMAARAAAEEWNKGQIDTLLSVLTQPTARCAGPDRKAVPGEAPCNASS